MDDLLREIAMGFEKSQILFTAFELGIFTKLKLPTTAQALISEMHLNPQVTGRFLDILTAMNLLSKSGDYYQTHHNFIPFLVEGEAYYSNYMEAAINERKIWLNLKQSIIKKTSITSEKQSYVYNTERLNWIALDCMHGRLQKTLNIITSLPEFKSARSLIDLGGGHGLFSIGFVQENPNLQVIVFDQPDITTMTQEYINQYGVRENIKTLSGNYLQDDFGTGYDIIFEALSLEGGREEAKILYKKVSNALNPNGLFITQLFTIDDSELSPLSILILDLHERIKGYQQMHLMTNREIFALFRDVGLTGEQIIDISIDVNLPMRMIIARKNIDKS
ncbi:class I SAM-dependent methyltransferase [uncultured Methanomethylovorans sp.]|uniref:class I SAM-dependent methyltransferase n=1 Tax=uncultured Methanomethylovorans sp. TaxID=183759 RepID=UPI00374786CC